MDNGSPAAEGVTVDGVQEHLGDGLEQVLGLKVRLPQSLSGTVQLLGRGSRNSKILRCRDTADAACQLEPKIDRARLLTYPW